MRTPGTPRTLSGQAGSSLIEVLVSVFILAIGILGIAAMQTGALRNNEGSLEQSAVVMLTHSIFESMRASMTSPSTESKNLSILEVRPEYSARMGSYVCSESGALGSDLAGNDLKRWIRNIQDSLGPDACGKIQCEAADKNLCTVTIKWNNSRSLGGKEAQEVSTRSRL
ncbi:MAG: type IV pilus modification protein PilV [Azoarcus sp.]|jgi:type IV pilus assembly protein PilV|nr:type IV pilus modification protein PilV [Azoarcus sp.]